MTAFEGPLRVAVEITYAPLTWPSPPLGEREQTDDSFAVSNRTVAELVDDDHTPLNGGTPL